jgi:hypothetical protein
MPCKSGKVALGRALGAEDLTITSGRGTRRTVEYSETFKRKMVQRMPGPKGKSATELGKEVNVHQVTPSRWKREACTLEYGHRPAQ